jgi:tetratricopeptide (TPR) repeat protein
MTDLYLEAMMHGQFPQKKVEEGHSLIKNKFQIAIEKAIDNYVDSYVFEDNTDHHGLLDPSSKKLKIREEMLLSQGFERDVHIHDAFKFLITDGFKYMDERVFKNLIHEFGGLNDFLNLVDLNNEIPENLHEFFNFSNQVIEGIVNTAVSKYREGDFGISLSLFVMLTALNPLNDDFWFRQAIAAQVCGNIDMALNAYRKTLELQPDLLSPWLFAIECKLKKGLVEEAKLDFEEFKNLQSDVELSEALTTYMSDLENSLSTIKIAKI